MRKRIYKAILFGILGSTKGGNANFRITENEFYIVGFFNDQKIHSKEI
ncbi:hypothetical protein [Polaribacter glomeratus]|nr:hypothetical protein [Polaribacter glomeratus]